MGKWGRGLFYACLGAAATVGLIFSLTASGLFDTPPKMPEPPAGVSDIATEGPWGPSYDIMALDWWRDNEGPKDLAEYRLPAGMTWEQVKAHYQPAFEDWDATNDKDQRRDRWFSRTWRQGKRYVALAYYPETDDRPFPILNVLSKPAK